MLSEPPRARSRNFRRQQHNNATTSTHTRDNTTPQNRQRPQLHYSHTRATPQPQAQQPQNQRKTTSVRCKPPRQRRRQRGRHPSLRPRPTHVTPPPANRPSPPKADGVQQRATSSERGKGCLVSTCTPPNLKRVLARHPSPPQKADGLTPLSLSFFTRHIHNKNTRIHILPYSLHPRRQQRFERTCNCQS